MTLLALVGTVSKVLFDDNGSNPEPGVLGIEKRPRGTLRGCDDCVATVGIVCLGVDADGSLVPASVLDLTVVWFRIGDNGLSSGDVIGVEKDAVEDIEDDVESGC